MHHADYIGTKPHHRKYIWLAS